MVNYRTFNGDEVLSFQDNQSSRKSLNLSFSKLIFPFQILLLGLFIGFTEYRYPIKDENRSTNYVTDYYPIYQDVHVMICLAIGFLLAYLKKYGYASTTYNLLLMCVVAQWSTLVNPWIERLMTGESLKGKIGIGIEEIIEGDVTAAVILISWCVIIGKTSRLQLLVVAICEPIVYAISQSLITDVLQISDTGGAMTIHFFAAYYGLAVSFIIGNRGSGHENIAKNYASDMFCMLGTLFLWVYWPSFNAVELGGKENQQMRAIINTYFSLTACVVATIGLAPLIDEEGKIDMEYVQNATLAGGVASATVANMVISPWGAVLVGFLSGLVSTLGFAYLTEILDKHLRVHDSAGVHNLHALPGIISGIASSIAVAAVKPESYPSLKEYKDIFPAVQTSYNPTGHRTTSTQALYQLLALPIVFIIAVAGGLINGLIIKKLNHPDGDMFYNDEGEFNKPEECIQPPSNGNQNRTDEL